MRVKNARASKDPKAGPDPDQYWLTLLTQLCFALLAKSWEKCSAPDQILDLLLEQGQSARNKESNLDKLQGEQGVRRAWGKCKGSNGQYIREQGTREARGKRQEGALDCASKKISSLGGLGSLGSFGNFRPAFEALDQPCTSLSSLGAALDQLWMPLG